MPGQTQAWAPCCPQPPNLRGLQGEAGHQARLPSLSPLPGLARWQLGHSGAQESHATPGVKSQAVRKGRSPDSAQGLCTQRPRAGHPGSLFHFMQTASPQVTKLSGRAETHSPASHSQRAGHTGCDTTPDFLGLLGTLTLKPALTLTTDTHPRPQH